MHPRARRVALTDSDAEREHVPRGAAAAPVRGKVAAPQSPLADSDGEEGPSASGGRPAMLADSDGEVELSTVRGFFSSDVPRREATATALHCNHRLGEKYNREAATHDLITMAPLESKHLEWLSPDAELRLCYNLSTVRSLARMRHGRIPRPPHFRESCQASDPWLAEVATKLRDAGLADEALQAERGLFGVATIASSESEPGFEFHSRYMELMEGWTGRLGKNYLYACPLCYEELRKEQLRRQERRLRPNDATDHDGDEDCIDCALDDLLSDPLVVLSSEPMEERFAALFLFKTTQAVRAHLKAGCHAGGHNLLQRELLPGVTVTADVTERLQQYALRGTQDSLVQRWLVRGTRTTRRYKRFVDYGHSGGQLLDQTNSTSFYWRSDGFFNACRFNCLYGVVGQSALGEEDVGGRWVLPGSPEARDFLPERFSNSAQAWREIMGTDAPDSDEQGSSGAECGGSEESRGRGDHAAQLAGRPPFEESSDDGEELRQYLVGLDGRVGAYRSSMGQEARGGVPDPHLLDASPSSPSSSGSCSRPASGPGAGVLLASAKRSRPPVRKARRVDSGESSP